MSPRLRAPALLTIGGVVALVLGGAAHGWGSVVDVAPIPAIVVVAFYIWAGRESDLGAAVRSQLDERQAQLRLKVQALVGRVLGLAAAVGYIVASATGTVLWPWAALLGLFAVSVLAGWMLYGERGSGSGSGSGDGGDGGDA